MTDLVNRPKTKTPEVVLSQHRKSSDRSRKRNLNRNIKTLVSLNILKREVIFPIDTYRCFYTVKSKSPRVTFINSLSFKMNEYNQKNRKAKRQGIINIMIIMLPYFLIVFVSIFRLNNVVWNNTMIAKRYYCFKRTAVKYRNIQLNHH